MAENESRAESIAKSAEAVADSGSIRLVGLGLYIGLFMGGLALYWASHKWDGRLIPQDKCYELQELGGKVYNVDTCTGQSELIEPTVEKPATEENQ